MFESSFLIESSLVFYGLTNDFFSTITSVILTPVPKMASMNRVSIPKCTHNFKLYGAMPKSCQFNSQSWCDMVAKFVVFLFLWVLQIIFHSP